MQKQVALTLADQNIYITNCKGKQVGISPAYHTYTKKSAMQKQVGFTFRDHKISISPAARKNQVRITLAKWHITMRHYPCIILAMQKQMGIPLIPHIYTSNCSAKKTCRHNYHRSQNIYITNCKEKQGGKTLADQNISIAISNVKTRRVNLHTLYYLYKQLQCRNK